MDDQARQILKGIITKFGASVCDDPSRCESLMRDHMAGYKKEIHLLTCALKEGVVKDLRFPPASATPAVLVPKLVKRLEDSYGLSTEGARLAVEAWAEALGVVSTSSMPKEALNASGVSQTATDNRIDTSKMDELIERMKKDIKVMILHSMDHSLTEREWPSLEKYLDAQLEITGLYARLLRIARLKYPPDSITRLSKAGNELMDVVEWKKDTGIYRGFQAKQLKDTWAAFIRVFSEL